jgi:hypothetical protein
MSRGRYEKGVYTSKYYTVACSRCAAIVGRPCVTVTDRGKYRPKGSVASTPHPSRIKDYERREEQQKV